MPKSRPLKRPHFFDGKFLTAADLNDEQNYVINKFKRLNQRLHGFGIVSGLRVIISAGQVVVEPGLALDCEGNEIVVESSQSLSPAGLVDLQTAYVGVRYAEEYVDPVAVGATGEQYSSVAESFALAFAKDNCNRGHRHERGRWIPCGMPHELTIAKLRVTPGGWRVDRRYRAPSVK